MIRVTRDTQAAFTPGKPFFFSAVFLCSVVSTFVVVCQPFVAMLSFFSGLATGLLLQYFCVRVGRAIGIPGHPIGHREWRIIVTCAGVPLPCTKRGVVVSEQASVRVAPCRAGSCMWGMIPSLRIPLNAGCAMVVHLSCFWGGCR